MFFELLAMASLLAIFGFVIGASAGAGFAWYREVWPPPARAVAVPAAPKPVEDEHATFLADEHDRLRAKEDEEALVRDLADMLMAAVESAGVVERRLQAAKAVDIILVDPNKLLHEHAHLWREVGAELAQRWKDA